MTAFSRLPLIYGAAAAGATFLALEALDVEDLNDWEGLVALEALPVIRARVS